MNPPKKNFEIKEGPSTNLEASAQGRQTNFRKSGLSLPQLPTHLLPRVCQPLLTMPGAGVGGLPLLEAATKTTLGKGRPLHHILSTLHASQSQA